MCSWVLTQYALCADSAPHAQIHQHFFCVRMDMSVDDPRGGRNLSIVEVRLPSFVLPCASILCPAQHAAAACLLRRKRH